MSDKIYDVPAEWKSRALIDDAKYKDMYARSVKDPDGFWAEQAERIDWVRRPTRIAGWSYDPVEIRWYEDGILNLCHNCVDRHLEARSAETAIVWEADEPGVTRTLTYGELHAEVVRMANCLKALGAGKGDRVTLYMPMILEAAVIGWPDHRLGEEVVAFIALKKGTSATPDEVIDFCKERRSEVLERCTPAASSPSSP